MAGGYSDYLKQFIENGGLQDSQQFLELLGNLNLPGPLKDQIDAANAAITGEEVCGPQCAAIAAGIVEAINVAGYLVDIFSGVPRTQKTIQTAQRLMQSSVIPIQVLGQWWNKAGGANIIDSNAPDITTYFKPAFDFTIQLLNIPFAAPDWYALSYVIGEGQPASVFDQSYAAQNRAAPMFVTQEAFKIQHPDDRYPDELVKVYQLVAHDFVEHITPQPGGGPGNGVGPGPQNGGKPPGGDGQPLTQQCCDAIVTAINTVWQSVNNLTTQPGLGNGPAIVADLNQIAAMITSIAQSFGPLIQAFGGGAAGLGQALQTVAGALETTITNAAGQEVNTLNAVSTSIVNALGRIDVDSENSLAGVAHAMQNVADCCTKLIQTLNDLFKITPDSVRNFWGQLINQQLIDQNLATAQLSMFAPVQ